MAWLTFLPYLGKNVRQARRATAAMLVLAGSLAVASPAPAATGPLDAPSRTGSMRRLTDSRIAFPLAARFKPGRSVSTDRRLDGIYDHAVRVGSRVCLVRLAARAQLQRRKPDLQTIARANGLTGYTTSSDGTAGATRWFVGMSDAGPTAFAWRRAPRPVGSAKRRFVVSVMTLTSATTGGRDPDCDAKISDDRGALRQAIRKVHVVAA